MGGRDGSATTSAGGSERGRGATRRTGGGQLGAAELGKALGTDRGGARQRLACLWQLSGLGSIPYSEVYLDAIQNAARSRSWFRVPAGAQ